MASSLLYDSEHRAAFEASAETSKHPIAVQDKIEVLDIDFLPDGSVNKETYRAMPASLTRTPKPRLRVIFAPVDYPKSENVSLLLELTSVLEVPSSFLNERVQSVARSFCFEGDKSSAFRTWFHFLCKAITAHHELPLWIRCGFFLTQSSHNETTLICFGASTDLVEHFKKLSAHVWRGLDAEPLGLLPIVLADLHAIVDQQVWTVNELVGDFEYHTIKATSSIGEFRHNFFNDLHWVAKNIIHLRESSDAALITCRDVLDMLSSEKSVNSAYSSTAYLTTLFESTVLRTTSLEKRMQNIINLSFNLVTQRDSQHIKSESSSMHTIALTTLIFLPISTVAAIFGSQFFAYTPPPPLDGEQQPELMLSGTFWLFWVVTVPLTLIVLGLWLWKHPDTVRRWTHRSSSQKPRSKGKSSDMEKARPP